VVDATGSMQNVIDDLKRRMDDLAATMQRLVPTARVGAVTYRDRDDDRARRAARAERGLRRQVDGPHLQREKVQAFLDGIVAEAAATGRRP